MSASKGETGEEWSSQEAEQKDTPSHLREVRDGGDMTEFQYVAGCRLSLVFFVGKAVFPKTLQKKKNILLQLTIGHHSKTSFINSYCSVN